LLVPNAALKLTPTANMIAELRERMTEPRHEVSERPEGEGAGGAPGGEGMGVGMGRPGMMRGEDDDSRGALWYLDDDGRVAVARIEKGATDGVQTEIIGGRGVSEGLQVISGVIEAEEEEGGSRNPLAAGPFGRRRG